VKTVPQKGFQILENSYFSPYAQLNKMRVKGMNALFDVKFHVSVNDRTIIALATATGFFVAALPSPRPPKLQQARGGDEQVCS
jgi:hypothetical protein